jgi:GNAT superfamily N-acetyltransferase
VGPSATGQKVNTISARTASVEDAAALVALINAAFSVERFFVTGDRTTFEEVTRLLGTGTFLVFDRPGDPPHACVYLEPRGDRAYLGLLAVDPARQGHGLGRQVMAAAEQYCLDAGCHTIDIKIVDLRMELPPFYKSLGFIEQGEAPFENPQATRPARFKLMFKELKAARRP